LPLNLTWRILTTSKSIFFKKKGGGGGGWSLNKKLKKTGHFLVGKQNVHTELKSNRLQGSFLLLFKKMKTLKNLI
jgi:hypothetical protein